MGAADDLIQGLLRESTEHRNIIPDGGVKDKHVLLDDGDKAVQRFGRKAADVDAVKKHLTAGVVVRDVQQAQQRGFSAAAGTDHRIGFACFQRGGKVLQHRLAWCVAVAGMLQFDLLHQPRQGLAARLRSLPRQTVAQLLHQGQRSLACGQQAGQCGDRLDDEVHQIDKGDDNAWRDAPAGKRQPGTQQKDTQLRRDAGKRTGGLQQRLQLQAGAFLLL